MLGVRLAFAHFVHLPVEGRRVPPKAAPLPDYYTVCRLRGWVVSAPCCCFSDLRCGGPCPFQERALALSREQTPRPQPCLSKRTWALGPCPVPEQRGQQGLSLSAWSQPQAPPPPPCLRQVPSHPWAILLHPGRRVTHLPCPVAVRTRGRCKAARSVPAQDGSEVFLMRQRPQSQGAQGQRRASAFPGTRLLKAHYTVQRQSLPKRQSKIKPPACIAQIRAAPDLSETPSSPMRGCRARLALPPSPRVGRGSAN